MGLGGATITLSVVGIRAFQRLDFARYGEPLSDASLDIMAGLLAGIAVAAFFGWRRSRPLPSVWQRGVISVLAVVGALLINFFFAIPADYLLGPVGLILLAAIAIAFGMAGSRWALKGAAASPTGDDADR